MFYTLGAMKNCQHRYREIIMEIKVVKLSFLPEHRKFIIIIAHLDSIIVRFIFQIFMLAFLGALCTAMVCLSSWISEDYVMLNAGWRMFLMGLYFSVFPWALAFMYLWLFFSLFVKTMRGSLMK